MLLLCIWWPKILKIQGSPKQALPKGALFFLKLTILMLLWGSPHLVARNPQMKSFERFQKAQVGSETPPKLGSKRAKSSTCGFQRSRLAPKVQMEKGPCRKPLKPSWKCETQKGQDRNSYLDVGSTPPRENCLEFLKAPAALANPKSKSPKP